jgi:hypothetical protein
MRQGMKRYFSPQHELKKPLTKGAPDGGGSNNSNGASAKENGVL